MTGSCAPTSSCAARADRSLGAGSAGGVPLVPLVPIGPSLPSTPPPNPLPPGVAFPIIGPELATYGVVQPLARQLGLQHPRHARRPEGRHLRAGWLRRCACGRRAETSSVDLPTRKPAALPTKGPACSLPVVRAVGVGPLLRPNDPQPLSSLRRSQRQRRSGRLPGRDRSSARIADRRPAMSAPASMAPMATCTPT